jgi:hypothetical protein
MEGNGYGLIQVLSWHLPTGIEENHENLHASQCPSWDLNQAPPQYKSRALLLDQHVFHET